MVVWFVRLYGKIITHAYLHTMQELSGVISFQLLIKTRIPTKFNEEVSCSDVVVIMLINVRMPTIVGILTFISRISCVLS